MNRGLVISGGAGLALAAGIGLAIAAGAGGASGSTSGSTSGNANGNANGGGYGVAAPATTGPAQHTTTVATAKTGLGRMLVDGRGRSLYLFEGDKQGMSNCDTSCASVWPPLTTTGAPKPGSGALAGQLGTLHRSDGTRQVTYHGHPLYLYVGDTQRGSARGEGLDQFGAEWYAVAPSGNKIDHG